MSNGPQEPLYFASDFLPTGLHCRSGESVIGYITLLLGTGNVYLVGDMLAHRISNY